MSPHTGRLILTSRDPFAAPDLEVARALLRSCGFIGEALPGRRDAYWTGENFLALVVFAGCSVQVDLTPAADPNARFCHVRISGPYPAPRLASGRNTRPPRCPSCRAPLRDWRRALEEGDGGALACPACHQSAPPWEWDWKRSAGYGRLFLQVEEVFPGEAEPSSRLMRLLSDIAPGAGWRHFFVQEL